MKTVRLGKIGLRVSRIGMGGIPIQRPAETEAVKIIQRALDLGVNFIDTAHGYGDSEERIGKALQGRREKVILATKTHMPDRVNAQAHLEESLRRLRTDYIDLWQLHNVSTFEKYQAVLGPNGALETAQKALADGTIRHIGISSHNLEVALQAVASGLFETIQFPFNFVNDEAESGLLPLVREQGLGFIAMKPFAGGRISNAGLAIKYLLQFPDVLPDPGIEKITEIEELVTVVERQDHSLTTADLLEIRNIRAQLGTRFCQWCGYCQPACPQKIYIPMLMNMSVMWNLWPPQDFFTNMPEIVAAGQTCLDCGECEERCPYQLPIRRTLEKNMKLFESIMTENSENRMVGNNNGK